MFEACNVRCTIGIYNWCTNDNGYWCSWVWLSLRYIPGREEKRYHKIQTVFIFSRFVCVFVFVLCFAVIWSFESMTKHCIRFAIVKMLWWCEFTKHTNTRNTRLHFKLSTHLIESIHVKWDFFPKHCIFPLFCASCQEMLMSNFPLASMFFYLFVGVAISSIFYPQSQWTLPKHERLLLVFLVVWIQVCSILLQQIAYLGSGIVFL